MIQSNGFCSLPRRSRRRSRCWRIFRRSWSLSWFCDRPWLPELGSDHCCRAQLIKISWARVLKKKKKKKKFKAEAFLSGKGQRRCQIKWIKYLLVRILNAIVLMHPRHRHDSLSVGLQLLSWRSGRLLGGPERHRETRPSLRTSPMGPNCEENVSGP